MLKKEVEAQRDNERMKIEVINSFKSDPKNLFYALDLQGKGFVEYEDLDFLFRKTKKQFVPRNYLFLLRRLHKTEYEDTISFFDLKEVLTPSFAYLKRSADSHNAVPLYSSIA